MDQFEFAIVGAGWRAEGFLRVAAIVPGMRVCGVVARNRDSASAIEAAWDVPCYSSTSELIDRSRPKFAIACVSAASMADTCLELAAGGVPILAETPPAADLESLSALYEKLTDAGAQIQVAEQFWAQPLHAARQAAVDAGLIGPVHQVNLSICHGYHAMSLIRRLLGVGFAPAKIRGQRFRSSLAAGPDRKGPPVEDRLVETELEFATLDFDDRLGVYDFCLPQYRSWIRGQRVCVRGERGEIIDDRMTSLKDIVTPISSSFLRVEAGHNGNHEGAFLKAIQLGGDWIYRNPFAPARLSDEEIAMAQCLREMNRYLETGKTFYSLAEACQDQYLALLCGRAMQSGEVVTSEAMPWADREADA